MCVNTSPLICDTTIRQRLRSIEKTGTILSSKIINMYRTFHPTIKCKINIKMKNKITNDNQKIILFKYMWNSYQIVSKLYSKFKTGWKSCTEIRGLHFSWQKKTSASP